MRQKLKKVTVDISNKTKLNRKIVVGKVKRPQQNNRLGIHDIKVGMRVNSHQLTDILDTYIILTDVKLVKNKIGVGTFQGTIASISKTPIRVTKDKSVLIFNNSLEREDYCEYE